MASIIEELQNLNDSIVDTELEYSAKKLHLKQMEAELLLNTNFEEELGKKRPTVDDKKAYILLKVKPLKEEVNALEFEVEALKRGYDIKKIEARMTGNFLNTVAGVCNDDYD
jgi:chromosome segregation ATPase